MMADARREPRNKRKPSNLFDFSHIERDSRFPDLYIQTGVPHDMLKWLSNIITPVDQSGYSKKIIVK